MDGRKGKLTDSLRFRLSLGLSLAILAVALVAGIFSFVSAYREAHELQDDVLRQVARLFDDRHLPLAHSGDSGRLANSDEESRVIVQYLPAPPATGAPNDGAGQRTDAVLALPASLPDGLQSFSVASERYRLLVKTLASGKRIAVAQETSFRDEIARDSAIRTVMPLLILVPILLLVAADLIRRMLRPITTLAAEIDRRDEQDLQPFEDTPLPAEFRPFVVAINRLLGRVGQAMNAQKRFIAEAAHELRSPMTALSLQAERLADADMSADARQRLSTLRRGIDRGRALLDQLLSLARAQSAATAPGKEVSVRQVFRSVLESLMPLADAKGIDIGVDSEDDPTVRVDETDLVAIVKNLVDNAIRYTPQGGKVDLTVRTAGHRVILQVSDSGPGIAPEERHRVFDPFHRIPGHDEIGSGLGLSIVRTIADRIGAEIMMDYTDHRNKTGLSVKVVIPTAG